MKGFTILLSVSVLPHICTQHSHKLVIMAVSKRTRNGKTLMYNYTVTPGLFKSDKKVTEKMAQNCCKDETDWVTSVLPNVLKQLAESYWAI